MQVTAALRAAFLQFVQFAALKQHLNYLSAVHTLKFIKWHK